MSRSRTEFSFEKYRSGVRRDQPHNFRFLTGLDCGFIRTIEVCGEYWKLHKCALRNEITKRKKTINEQNSIKVKESKQKVKNLRCNPYILLGRVTR